MSTKWGPISGPILTFLGPISSLGPFPTQQAGRPSRGLPLPLPCKAHQFAWPFPLQMKLQKPTTLHALSRKVVKASTCWHPSVMDEMMHFGGDLDITSANLRPEIPHLQQPCQHMVFFLPTVTSPPAVFPHTKTCNNTFLALHHPVAPMHRITIWFFQHAGRLPTGCMKRDGADVFIGLLAKRARPLMARPKTCLTCDAYAPTGISYSCHTSRSPRGATAY